MQRWLLFVLIFAVSVVGLSMGATLPLVALRQHEAGAGSLAIGVLSALPAVGMILAAVLVNRLCRRFSGRQLYLLCFVLCLLGTLALLPAQPPQLLLVGARLLLGLGMGVLVILGESWVNELCSEQRRGQVVAFYAACFTGCQLGGPAMISLFGASSSWPVLLVVVANLLALALVWHSLPADWSESAEEAPRRFSLVGFLRVAPALCLGVLFFAFFDAVVLSLFPVYASSHGYAVGVAALMASVILLGDMLFQVPLGWLSDRLDRRILHLACGVLTLALGLALPWLIDQRELLWPALMLLGAAAGGIYTLALVLIGQHFRGPELVTANACVGMLWGVGSLLGPLLSGALMGIGPQGLPLALCLAVSLFVVAAFGALPLARRALS
ncbi:MFS transporter [Aquipseudomonas ullengensis]|uniref:MFS transporter n=1 Tax=Aquipseudomonas ullengensis TaxID=2759166 RepID=A0A7W4QB65_9GAMM|nr:MFS transporter [Pseudomonas ullengensis]MBB2493636.1 MFS transporter [Pseudomonas ullengensis]